MGTTTLQLGERPVAVWYPAVPGSEVGATKATYDLRTFLPLAEQSKVADLTGAIFTMDAYEGLPAAPGPFPVVLFSHGFAGYRYQSTFLTTALASWGFVVAAPEHLSRDLTAVLDGRISTGQSDVDDLKQTLALLNAQGADPASPLAGRIDATRVAAVGHSAGGGASFQLADDPANGIDAVVGLAPAISPEQPVLTAAVPSLTMAGTADALIPVDRIEQAWTAGVASPKRFMSLGDVTHLGFTEICLLTPEQGGVLQAAKAAGVSVPDLIARLFADGCDAKYTAAADAFPVIRHATIAEIRAALGIDPAPVGLDDSLTTAFPPVEITTKAG